MGVHGLSCLFLMSFLYLWKKKAKEKVENNCFCRPCVGWMASPLRSKLVQKAYKGDVWVRVSIPQSHLIRWNCGLLECSLTSQLPFSQPANDFNFSHVILINKASYQYQKLGRNCTCSIHFGNIFLKIYIYIILFIGKLFSAETSNLFYFVAVFADPSVERSTMWQWHHKTWKKRWGVKLIFMWWSQSTLYQFHHWRGHLKLFHQPHKPKYDLQSH